MLVGYFCIEGVNLCIYQRKYIFENKIIFNTVNMVSKVTNIIIKFVFWILL